VTTISTYIAIIDIEARTAKYLHASELSLTLPIFLSTKTDIYND